MSNNEAAAASAQQLLVVDDDRTLRRALSALLQAAGFSVAEAADGASALDQIHRRRFDLIVLDLGLPRVGGLDVLSEIQKLHAPPKVIVVSADDTPGAVLQAIRDHAYQYVVKPVPPNSIVEMVKQILSAPARRPIEVISARPEWLELVAPCDLETAERIQSFVEKLDAGLPDEVRDAVGQAFRELLLNAIEWGGQFDPNRTVRIACLRTQRMVLYRIADPGPGFSLEHINHAAIANQPGEPVGHMRVREQKGLRPGGFGLMLTRTLVDELVYNEAHNEVVFVKYLDEPLLAAGP
jgi:CheY-like chemotaxis protein/anti-sigma regulatory factor (Ser/Thr protein kinase)